MILTIISIIFFTLTILGFSRKIWWFTALDFPRLQYAIFQFILFVTAILIFNVPSIIINFIGMAINLYRIKDFLPKKTKNSETKKRDILCVNVFKDNEDFKSLHEALKIADPEILLMMEVTETLEKNLDTLIEGYEFRLQTPVRDGFSICLLSKHKMENPQISYHGPNDTPLLQAGIKLNNQTYQIYSAHPKPALNQDWYRERAIYFDKIIDIIKKTDLPPIVLGDFNSVPWESHFVDFCNKTELKSTAQGNGYKITWPTYFSLMGVPMDHILIPKQKAYSALSIGPNVGSDHYPIAINL